MLCCLSVLLVVLLPSTVAALAADVDYTEGEVYIIEDLGDEYDARIGDSVAPGDTVTTGVEGYAELSQQNTVIKVLADTVFTLFERAQAQTKTSVMTCVLGAVSFKVQKLTGQAPEFATNSCAAGVRGTDFTLYAGADGSTLIIVEEGTVIVEAAGTSVELAPEEGVEVGPGEPPGEKFSVKRDQMDYRTWNQRALDRLTDEPLRSLSGLRRRLEHYTAEIDARHPLYLDNMQKLEQERDKLTKIEEEQGKDARTDYYSETVFPLEVETTYLYLNIRYFSLASLSLRRYVLGRMYLLLKLRYLSEPEDPTYRSFLTEYAETLDLYEQKIVPFLVDADI